MYKKIIIPTLGLAALFLTVFLILSHSKKESFIDKVAVGSYEPIVVLELFTSQGCSSCPPADVLLEKAKRQFPEKVFALSYHVDYWNYIGWEDPFSKSQYTKKQTAYNQKFDYNGNYTPEMIINGNEHFVGSNSTKLFSKINEYKKVGAQTKVSLANAIKNGSQITFEYEVEGNTAGVVLHAVLVLDKRITSVKRGENRNRTLTNSNIVVAENYLELGQGSGSIGIPQIVLAEDELTLMLFAETGHMNILGASKIRL